MSSDILVRVSHLSRFYGPNCAVDDISFELKRGEVLGFLGPNGAGKSTTMQVLTGNLAPTAGAVQICGMDLLDQPKDAKAEIGYLPEQPPLYTEFTVDEYLRFCARLNRIRREGVDAAVARTKERCGLGEVGRRLIANLSKGYQQRVGIAQAVIHSPSVVVLDEPTVGLDPIQIREIRKLIRELGEEHGVILSTHILPEVTMTCDHVQIINQGKLVFNDSIENLTRKMDTDSFVLGCHRLPAPDVLAGIPGVDDIETIDETHVRIHHDPGTSPAEAVARRAVEEDWGLFELAPERKSLEQIFVELTSMEKVSHPGQEAA